MAEKLSFGPFRRSITSIESHLIPADAVFGGINYLVDPVAGGMFKRAGSAITGDTLTGTSATTGLLESAPEYVPCRLREFFSDALADGALGGSPTHSVLFRKEASSTAWPTVDDGIFGTEYVRRPSANYTLLEEFGSSCYPTTGGAFGGDFEFRVIPWWYESGEGGYSRGAFEFARRSVLAGSWNSVDIGRWRYYPGLRALPIRWDGGCNNDSSTIANVVRLYPTGPLPPPWLPVATDTDSGVVGTNRPWKDGDTFYYSIMYQFEDGSFSAPVMPRPVSDTLTGGYGLKVVGSEGGASYYKSVTYTNIPLGPSGTIARILLRSPKENRAAASTAITVSITPDVDGVGGLQILGILDNNTQTSFVDGNADDSALVKNDDVVRFDLMMPPRARYYGTGDNRLIAGYTLPNPSAIILTCPGISADWDVAGADEDNAGLSWATASCYRITATALELVLTNGGAVVASSTITVDWATYTTLQAVVDKVNTSSAGGATGQWRAELAPGADPTAASSGLARSTITGVSSTSAASVLLTVDEATGTAVPLGYKIYDSAGKVAAGTYVVSKAAPSGGNVVLTISAAASGSGSAAALVFYADCGDEACVTTAGSKGWIRAFGSPLYGMVYFKRASLVNYNRPARNRIYFTTSSPGAASTGVSLAANAWVRSNRRDGRSNTGQVMGIVDVQGAAVVLYRNRKALFINERGNNTGEDFDMRLQTLDDDRGCVSPWGVLSVNGCAIYPSPSGIEATDKSKRTVKLSSDIYESVRGRGDLAYEVPLCVAAAAADSPDCWLGGAVWGHRLVFSYRVDAVTFGFLVYDFSRGVDATGLESVADAEGKSSYGWSTPCFLDTTNYLFGPRAMGAVAKSGGLLFYGALNDNGGTTDGRVDQMFTGANDNGVKIYGTATSKLVLAPSNTRLVLHNATVVHKVNYAGVTMSLVRTPSASNALSLSTSGSAAQLREKKQNSQSGRSPGSLCALVFDDNTTGTGGLVWSVDVEIEVLQWIGG